MKKVVRRGSKKEKKEKNDAVSNGAAAETKKDRNLEIHELTEEEGPAEETPQVHHKKEPVDNVTKAERKVSIGDILEVDHKEEIRRLKENEAKKEAKKDETEEEDEEEEPAEESEEEVEEPKVEKVKENVVLPTPKSPSKSPSPVPKTVTPVPEKKVEREADSSNEVEEAEVEEESEEEEEEEVEEVKPKVQTQPKSPQPTGKVHNYDFIPSSLGFHCPFIILLRCNLLPLSLSLSRRDCSIFCTSFSSFSFKQKSHTFTHFDADYFCNSHIRNFYCFSVFRCAANR